MSRRLSPGFTVGVVGASGGVGASTMAVALGVVATRAGRRCVCIDARALSGGLDVVAGLDREPGMRWPDLSRVDGPVPGADLVAQLPTAAGLAVLSHTREPVSPLPWTAADGVLSGLRAAVDLCLVDLPAVGQPGWSWWCRRVDVLLLVVGSHVLALAAAAAVASQLTDGPGGGTWLVQRVGRRSGDLAQISARVLDLPVAASVPDDAQVRRALRRGQPPASGSGPLRRACEHALTAVAKSGDRR